MEITKNKRGIRFYLHIYKMLFIQCLKTRMSYRSDFIISMIGMVIMNLSGIAGFLLIFNNFNTICGYNKNELLFIFAFFLIAITPNQCFFDNNWNLAFEIMDGKFIIYNLRPINVFFYFMSNNFDLKGIWRFIIGVSLLVYSWINLDIGFSVIMLLKLIVLLIFSSLSIIALINAAAASGFFFIGGHQILMFTSSFFDYTMYPITIFNSFFKALFSFIIPIGFFGFYPCQALLRPENNSIMPWLTIPLGVIYFILSYKLWTFGARRYGGTGS